LNFFSCEDEAATSSSLRITGVFPSSNPIGGPVKITGEDFGETSEVYFDGVRAIIDQRNDTILTMKVPQGISGTGISIKVEDEKGSDQLSDVFDVLSSYPDNLPSSAPSIFIPSQGLTGALPYSVHGADYIWHKNVYDTDHDIGLMIRRQANIDHFRSWEEVTIGGTLFRSNILTDGEILLKYDTATHEAVLHTVEIDRANSNPAMHPYPSEEYAAQYFSIKNFAFPSAFLSGMGDICLTSNFLLLESKATGRQYLFVVYDKNGNHC